MDSFRQEEVAGRVCAIRKSQAAIERAQRRLKEKQQQGKSVGPETRQYAQYVLVFTTLPASAAGAEQLLEAYRLRWQVELTFKRMNFIAQIDICRNTMTRVAALSFAGNCS